MYNAGMMLLLIHISLAFSSLVLATAALTHPSRVKIRINYGLAAATLVSGGVLVWRAKAPLTSACISGILYTGFVVAMTAAARLRLDKTD